MRFYQDGYRISFNEALILLGCLFYLMGLSIVVRHYLGMKFSSMILNWSNANCIIHGALSITGLASLLTHALPDSIIIFIWIITTGLLVIVEGLSFVKLMQRIKNYGLLKGVFVYDISQWTRNFTYGMYYAFTLVLSENNLSSNGIVDLVIQYGQYLVFGLLVIEIIIFFSDKFSQRIIPDYPNE